MQTVVLCAVMSRNTVSDHRRFGEKYRIHLRSPPKRWQPHIRLHVVVTKKTTNTISTAVRASNFVYHVTRGQRAYGII